MEQVTTQVPPAAALARVADNSPPAAPRPAAGGALAAPVQAGPAAKSAAARSPRRFILPVILIAGLGYGAHLAYDWFVEGRFLVSTDDAYVGATTSIIAAKVSGHVVELPIVVNQ